MVVTTAPFTAGNLAASIPEVWTPEILEALFAKTVFMNFCTDLSEYTTEGGSTFDVPDIFTNTFTVQTQSTEGTEVTTSNPAQNKVQLAVNTHKYIAFLIGYKDLAQLATKYNLQQAYIREAAAQLTDAVESDIGALWSSFSTNLISDTAHVLSDAEIRQAINKLDTGHFDLDECAWFFSPYTFWVQLGANAKYYDASQVGLLGEVAKGFTRTGNFGSASAAKALKGVLYGIPIYTTTNVVSGLQTYRNLLLHKSAICFAIQNINGAQVNVQAENAIRNLGLLVVADIVYGVKILRDPAGVVMSSSNVFINS